MSRAATRLAATALLVATAGSAAPATGAEPPPASQTGATPAFASLPEGHVAPLPEAAPPARIPAREKAEGFSGRAMPAEQALQMRRAGQGTAFSYLFPGEEQAKAFTFSHGSRDEKTDACLVDGGNADTLSSGKPTDEAAAEANPRDWPSSYSSMLSFQFETTPGPGTAGKRAIRSKRRATRSEGGEVHAVHTERLVSGADGRASLEMADAWFDVRTRGVRVIARSTLPLARVFVGPNGLEVYAARDGEAVQVVVRAPDHASDDAAVSDALRSRLRSLAFTLPDHNGGNADCGHARLTLRAQAGAGQMATLQSTAFLPALPGDPVEVPEGESEDARGARLVGAMRQRPFQLSVSATATSADRAPVLSLALGWTGRERTGG